MPITFHEAQANFSDVVDVADADSLLEWLQQTPNAKIDLEECTHVHPAVIQILLASGAYVSVWPVDPEIQRWLSIIRATAGDKNGQP